MNWNSGGDYVTGKGTTALGVIGTTLGGLSILGNSLLGGMTAKNTACSDDHCVNRYEAAQAARIAQLETDVKFRDAELYSNNKYVEVYTVLNNEIQRLKQQLCDQAVTNQKTADSFALAAADLAAVKSELKKDIAIEAEKRCCGDNSIVNYLNATFYPKMVADVTTGTTTTAQNTYNPIPSCGTVCPCN